jgi:hypothetical protein
MQPLPSPPSDRQPLIPDEIQWAIMCRPDGGHNCDGSSYEQFVTGVKTDDVASVTVVPGMSWLDTLVYIDCMVDTEFGVAFPDVRDAPSCAQGVSSEHHEPGKYEAQGKQIGTMCAQLDIQWQTSASRDSC